MKKMAKGGLVTAGMDDVTENPYPEARAPEMGTAGMDGLGDPSIIPEDIKEFVNAAHQEREDSRPDENWRIMTNDELDGIAPYKLDEESESMADDVPGYADGGVVETPEPESKIITFLRNLAMKHGGDAGADQSEAQKAMNVDAPSEIKNYADGGVITPNQDLMDVAPPGTGLLSPSPVPLPPPAVGLTPAAVPGGMPPRAAAPMPPMPPAAAPAPTDQSYMDRANKMLGLNPQDQASFMKLLGDKSQKAQIGAGIAGIGDAIASGGTLGKVNPGGLGKSEDLIQGKENAGISGMQTIRGNQEKSFDVSQKMQAQDPQSPLSKYAQKAYAGIGKKLGLDLSHASAALIGDVSGKGVEALNTEYQNQLKMMGLDLQKKQVEATIGNQRAERDIAREGHQADAAKTLADRGIFKTLANAIPGTAGHAATKVLEKQAAGFPPDVLAYAEKHGITPEQAQEQKQRRAGSK